jgi:ribosomal 50S subunit-associated protein YjgA (DUF615 family)
MTATIVRQPRDDDQIREMMRTIRRRTLTAPREILRELHELSPEQLERIAALLLIGARR